MIKKGKSDSAPIVSKRKLKPTAERKEELQKQDFFMEALSNAVSFLEKNSKKVIYSISAVVVAALIVTGVVVYTQSAGQQYADLYYDAQFEMSKRLQDAKEKKLQGKLDQEDISELLKKLKVLESKSASEPEVHLALYDIAVIYYNLQDYEKAVVYFDQAYDKKVSFHLTFLALYNRANCFFNIGYKYQKNKEYDKALSKYNEAISSYEAVEKEFPDSPVFPLAYRYRGLTKEFIAECYQGLNKPDKVKQALADSKKVYNQLLDFYKKKMPTSSPEEIESAIRRVDIKIAKLG